MSTNPLHPCKVLRPFQTFGWMPDLALSLDDNLLDLLLIVTRNSICLNCGHMGCLLVGQSNPPLDFSKPLLELQGGGDGQQILYDSILTAANNRPLFTEYGSDIHAEVNAIGQCARHGISTEGCTSYITMPPCKNCLGALVMAGVKRIVFLSKTPSYLEDIGKQFDIEISEHTLSERQSRVDAIISKYKTDNQIDEREEILREREKRKRLKQERKQAQRERKRKKQSPDAAD